MAKQEGKQEAASASVEQAKGLVAEAFGLGNSREQLVLVLIEELGKLGVGELTAQLSALSESASVLTDQCAALHASGEDLATRLERLEMAVPELAGRDTAVAAATFNPNWLKGLSFSGARSQKKIVDGRPRLVPTPFERPLAEADVLSFRVDPEAGTVILVAADGRKHTLEI